MRKSIPTDEFHYAGVRCYFCHKKVSKKDEYLKKVGPLLYHDTDIIVSVAHYSCANKVPKRSIDDILAKTHS